MEFLTSRVLRYIVLIVGLILALVGSRVVHNAKNLPAWGILSLVVFLLAQIIAIAISPPERDMGILQKILYVHVPTAWNALLSSAIVFVASVMYLWKRMEKYDLVAVSAAEIGTALTALTLAQGMIWGKPTWGIWWTWDARLTSTAVLLVVYVSYLSLRAFTEDEDRRALWSAAVGILGFVNSLIVYMSVRWWRTLHQVQSTPETMSPEYVLGLDLNAYAFLYLVIFFVASRYHTARMEREADRRLEEAALAGGPVRV